MADMHSTYICREIQDSKPCQVHLVKGVWWRSLNTSCTFGLLVNPTTQHNSKLHLPRRVPLPPHPLHFQSHNLLCMPVREPDSCSLHTETCAMLWPRAGSLSALDSPLVCRLAQRFTASWRGL